MTTARPRVAFGMQDGLRERLFTPAALGRLASIADAGDEVWAGAAPPRDAEILVTGWGCPPLDATALDAMPSLRAVVHCAGSVKHHVTDAAWQRGVEVSSATAANALPVAEYTLAVVLLAGKAVLEVAEEFRRTRSAIDWSTRFPTIGNVGKRVGIVGASTIGRRVIELLRPFDLEVVVADPYLDDSGAAALGLTRVELDELVATSDVVSLHAPDLPETWHLLDRRRLASMRPGATLVNTARGALVDTEALTEVVLAGQIGAVLDVTDPEPLPADSPLWDHPRVLLTPHVAGSLGTELTRLGDVAVAELDRFAAGQPFAHPVRREELDRRA
ncbi:MAG TPA: hydroxyacid dehydrogenase [Pedococcus sp.]|nr:hydroxyacid dehydrogenase [Pedococcus sp.]